MDYGSWLKSQGVRNISQSRHYKKQSPLKGSVREVRGQIVRALSEEAKTEALLRRTISSDERFTAALDGLLKEGIVQQSCGQLHLTN